MEIRTSCYLLFNYLDFTRSSALNLSYIVLFIIKVCDIYLKEVYIPHCIGG